MTEKLRLNGTRAQRLAVLRAIDPDLVRKDENDNDVEGSVYTHEIALHFISNVMTKRATRTAPAEFGGPAVMIKLFGTKANKMDQNGRIKASLPARAAREPSFVNNVWFGE